MNWIAVLGISAAGAFLLDLLTTAATPRFAMHRRQGLWDGLGALLGGCYGAAHGHLVLGAFLSALGAQVGGLMAAFPVIATRNLRSVSWRRGTNRRPDRQKPLMLVTDTHWTHDLSDLEELAQLHPHADWLFLGDIFHLWAAVPGMETQEHREFLRWVKGRRANGAWVGYTSGNREYFMVRHAAHFDFASEGAGAYLEGEGLAWEHGDLINRKNRRHRISTLLFRSFPSYLLFRWMPGPVAKRLVSGLMKGLRHQTYYLPEEDLARAAAENPGHVFVIGHFHHARSLGAARVFPPSRPSTVIQWVGGELAGI